MTITIDTDLGIITVQGGTDVDKIVKQLNKTLKKKTMLNYQVHVAVTYSIEH